MQLVLCNSKVYINFTDLQYEGLAKKQDVIHRQVTHAWLLLEVTDVLRAVGMRERNVMCASAAVCGQLFSHVQR